jgi:hypothetical protein
VVTHMIYITKHNISLYLYIICIYNIYQKTRVVCDNCGKTFYATYQDWIDVNDMLSVIYIYIIYLYIYVYIEREM